MLFYKELITNTKQYLVPSLAVYTIGNALIGHIQGSYFRSKGMKDNFTEPLFMYYGLYIGWFILFIIYLGYRGVI